MIPPHNSDSFDISGFFWLLRYAKAEDFPRRHLTAPIGMRIGEHRNILTLLATACVLFAQNDASPDHSGLPDVHRIVESSIAATYRDWRARLEYSYRERDMSRRLDPAGRVKSEDVDVSITIPVDGVPYEKLLERNGRPPSADEERKQKDT